MAGFLVWSGAIGGVVAGVASLIAAAGTWRTEATARWQARAERLRTERARYEAELHRQRFAEVWDWLHSQPDDGPDRYAAARWYNEWTGSREPFQGGAQGAIPPGIGSRDAAGAYERYVDLLALKYERTTPPPSVSARRLPGMWRIQRRRPHPSIE